eukprot:Ihof_evm22s9 gene=Ihof_evmTU22s9
MIGMIRLFVLLCSAFATVSASPVSALPVFAQPSEKYVRICVHAMSKHCSNFSMCKEFSLNGCHGFELSYKFFPSLSFSFKVIYDEETNYVLVQRFQDSQCLVPHRKFPESG